MYQSCIMNARQVQKYLDVLEEARETIGQI